MNISREQKRFLMFYEFKLGNDVDDTVRSINEAFGAKTVEKITVYKLQEIREKRRLNFSIRNQLNSTVEKFDLLFFVWSNVIDA